MCNEKLLNFILDLLNISLIFSGTTGVSRRPALFNVFRHKPKPEPARVVEKKPSFLRNFKAAFQVILF